MKAAWPRRSQQVQESECLDSTPVLVRALIFIRRFDRYAALNENFVLAAGPHNGLGRAQRALEMLCEPAEGSANTGARAGWLTPPGSA
jgi:hypothetical protein